MSGKIPISQLAGNLDGNFQSMTFKEYEHTNHTNARSRISTQGDSRVPTQSAPYPLR
jgi:hypothetical protein